MLDQLKNPPAGFEEVIRRHFRLKRDSILQVKLPWWDIRLTIREVCKKNLCDCFLGKIVGHDHSKMRINVWHNIIRHKEAPHEESGLFSYTYGGASSLTGYLSDCFISCKAGCAALCHRQCGQLSPSFGRNWRNCRKVQRRDPNKHRWLPEVTQSP